MLTLCIHAHYTHAHAHTGYTHNKLFDIQGSACKSKSIEQNMSCGH